MIDTKGILKLCNKILRDYYRLESEEFWKRYKVEWANEAKGFKEAAAYIKRQIEQSRKEKVDE